MSEIIERKAEQLEDYEEQPTAPVAPAASATPISLSKDDLKDIVASAVTAAVTAANAPKPLTDAQKAEIAQAQQHRLDMAESIVQKKAETRAFQAHSCTHEHAARAGGGSHCVHVHDNDFPGSPGFVLCQACGGRFRPESAQWRKLDPEAHFDTPTFNRLYQACVSTGEILV